MRSLSDLGIVSLDLNATPGSTKDNGNTVGLVSSYQTDDNQTHTLADVWFVADRPKPEVQAAAVAPGVLSATPTEMQMGVFGLVDAMSTFKRFHANKKFDLYEESIDPQILQGVKAGFPLSSTINQMVLALSQFDANGNQIMGQNIQQNAVSALTAPDSSKRPGNTVALLAIGNG